MISTNSRDELNDLLFDEFISNSKYIEDSQNIAIKLKNKIRINRTPKIFGLQLDITIIKDEEAYFLAKYFYEDLQDELIKEYDKDIEQLKDKINPANFFTPIEINEFDNLSDLDYTIKTTNKIVIKECIETTSNLWSCGRISIQDLVSMLNNSLLTYDKNAQRETEKRIVHNKVVEKIKIYKKSVKEIKQSMLDGSYFPTEVAFCILANGFEKYSYNRNKREITIEIDDNSKCLLMDGMHRLTAGTEALRENPNLEQYMKVAIFHMDIASARRFVRQESKKNEISKEVLSYYDTDNIASKIVNDIDIEGTVNTNFIKGHIGIDSDSVKLQFKYCTYDTLIKAISDNFDLDKKDLRDIRIKKEYLINFFNELISIYRNEFDNVKNSRNTSYITSNNAFYGYVLIASKLYNKDKWQDKLYDILNNINLKKDNKGLKGKGFMTENLTGKQLSILYSFFKSYIIDEQIEEVSTDEN